METQDLVKPKLAGNVKKFKIKLRKINLKKLKTKAKISFAFESLWIFPARLQKEGRFYKIKYTIADV